MSSKYSVIQGESRYAVAYVAILCCLVVVQPVVSDSILFYAFIGMAFFSCFLPFNIPFPIFLSLCLMLLFLVDVHSPFDSILVYVGTALGGVAVVVIRVILTKFQKRGFEGSKAQLDAFWATIVDGLVVIDDKAVIVAVNPAVEKLFGYAEAELIGKNVKVLMPQRYAEKHDGYVSAYNNTGQAMIIGTGREVEGECKDGSRFPMYLAVSKFEKDGQRYYCGIVRDMSVEKEIRENLVEARDKAETASNAKTKFLSSISHEVRTPLNAILGFTQLLEKTLKNNVADEQRDYMKHIQSSGEHLMALINEVLDMSQIESGKLQLSIERINAESVLRESIDMVLPVAEKYDVTVHHAVELPAGAAVLADRVRLRQALINLGTNAIKYNRRGGTVHWRVYVPEQEVIRFEVVDTGLGLANDQREALFEPFNRLGREASSVEGTGIGLSVTKTVVEAMQGTVDFKSVEGAGTTFWIDLPVATLVPEKMAEYERQINFRSQDDSHHDDSTATILYIEDNPANTVLMQRFLGKLPGVNLINAKTAEIGLQIVREWPVDLILMDLNLPGMDGFDAQLLLAKDDKTKNIPVVAVSADVNPTTIKRAMNVGFKKFISKPFNLSEAEQTIRSVLANDNSLIH